MVECVRLLYVSKFTQNDDVFKTELMNILMTSVDRNALHEITGVLSYGNGYFVQCLEGEKTKVSNLYFDRILKDSRHKGCQILYFEEQVERIFSEWAMKFAPINPSIRAFFQLQYAQEFNPTLLTARTIGPFIKLLAQQNAWEYYI
jgi:restriction endonuclease